MGKVVYFGLLFLGCFVFGSSGTPVEDEVLPEASDEQAAAKSPCPSGTLYFRQNCYEFFQNSLSWDSAEISCQKLRHGGHLASFSSMREEKMVSAHIRSRSSTNYVWIGLSATSESNQRRWEWSDGSHYSHGSPLWDNRIPSTHLSSYECVYLYNVQYPTSSTRWSDYPCEYSWPYVCKYKPGN
ncbi:snaclec alboaggregin-A subunit alpha-like [Sphaerodactylus townsendi]|uniref:Uncharacterized protein n=1 Tax=Sphaerodactylus townsendi TaxID=933632 RepID=A0ACB8FM36_9SAUR|nr:snaclec alboaggregin-A subunit alpha-like [Sphaerodactylus townsendi]